LQSQLTENSLFLDSQRFTGFPAGLLCPELEPAAGFEGAGFFGFLASLLDLC